MGGSSTVSNQFRATEWGKEHRVRLDQIAGYVGSRLSAMDNRFMESMRFVEPSPGNRATFSYEFSSMLRDSGSVFDSAMRELLKTVKYSSPRSKDDKYDIRDYRRFLSENVNRQGIPPEGGIESIVLSVNSFWAGTFQMPFAALAEDEKPLEWWVAYNNVKHSDLERVAEGNLVNCLNALGAVAILYALIGYTAGRTSTFGLPHFFEDMDEIKAAIF